MNNSNDTHTKTLGYILWIFGFTGSHRFFYGKQTTGLIWLFTGGLCGIGWLIDFFLIPGMDREADIRYKAGSVDYSVAWMLLTFLGPFGVHRFYMNKLGTGLIYFFTAGLIGAGIVYDFLTLNEQINAINSQEAVE